MFLDVLVVWSGVELHCLTLEANSNVFSLAEPNKAPGA